MKIQILRVCVLLVSISAASVLVWNATRNRSSADRGSKDRISPAEMQGSSKSKAIGEDMLVFDPDHMQVSPKSGPVMSSDDIVEIVEEPKKSTVTDEEVKKKRDAMLSTSKSGIIMSDDKIREMLENQKKEELEYGKKRKLMPSSKSIDAILKPEDVEEMIEGSEPEKKKAPLMHSSKAFIGPIIEQEDLEKIIESKKQDPHAKQELPPQVDPFSAKENKEK